MTKPRFHTVFFDSGGTLYMETKSQPQPSAARLHEKRADRVRAMLSGFGYEFDRQAIVDALSRSESACKKQWGVSYTFDRLMTAMTAGLGITPGPEVEACLAHAYAGPRHIHWLFPGTLEMLRKLTDEGIYLGVIANTAWPGHCMDRAFAGVGILPFMNVRLYSGDIGLEKPDPAFFRLAEKVSGRSGPGVLYVGDNYGKDVVCAHAVGWQAALRGNSPVDQPRKADLDFTDWGQVTRFVLEG